MGAAAAARYRALGSGSCEAAAGLATAIRGRPWRCGGAARVGGPRGVRAGRQAVVGLSWAGCLVPFGATFDPHSLSVIALCGTPALWLYGGACRGCTAWLTRGRPRLTGTGREPRVANGCGPGPFGSSITFSLVALLSAAMGGDGDRWGASLCFCCWWPRVQVRYLSC